MTDALNPTVPAGWYPDPWGSASQRWWDGTAWTGNLYPQPEAEQKPDAPAPAINDAGAAEQKPDADYEPVAVRSTYEPVASYRTAAAPTPDSPFPSRRALRELTSDAGHEAAPATGQDEPSAEHSPRAEATSSPNTADALPAFTQAPEFSPEPVSALPSPVWSEAPVAATQAPAETPAAAAAPAADLPAPPAEAPAPTATTPAASAADDGWAASLASWDNVETTTAPPDTAPIFGDAPPVSYSQRAMRYQPLHGRTSPVWLIVFIPLLQSASVIGSLFLFPGLMQFDPQFGAFVPVIDPMSTLLSLRDWLIFAALPLTLAFFLFTFILGFQDRARLRLLGHDQAASPWWIVLSPLVYLIVRSVRVRQCTGRRGSGPLTTYICLYIAPPIAFFVAQAVTSALYGAIPV